MTVISTETVGVDGKLWKRVIKFHSKGTWNGQFTIDLPESMAKALGYELIHADTRDKVEREWKAAFKAYTEASTTKRTVIGYHIEITAKIEDRTPRSEDDYTHVPPLLDEDELSFAHGMALSIAAGVFTLVTVKTGDHVVERLEPHHSSIPSSAGYMRFSSWQEEYRNKKVAILEWTEEREKFFALLIHQFENMILMVNDFLGMEYLESLRMLIDNKAAANLLPSIVPPATRGSDHRPDLGDVDPSKPYTDGGDQMDFEEEVIDAE